MRVYIAGNSHENSRYDFEQAARSLARYGAEVSSPYHPDLGVDPTRWTRPRIDHVLGCDAVVVLPGGGMPCVDELLARTAGVPVRQLDETLDVLAGLRAA